MIVKVDYSTKINIKGIKFVSNWSHTFFVLVSTIAGILLVMVCVAFAIKIHKSGKFQSIIGVNSIPEENIEELLESYGSLAPKRYKYSQLKEIT
jgi:interleukin-1 receptor-associated kinase 1